MGEISPWWVKITHGFVDTQAIVEGAEKNKLPVLL